MAQTSAAVRRAWNAEHYTKVTLDIPKELLAEFKTACAERGDSMAGIIRCAMTDYISSGRTE